MKKVTLVRRRLGLLIVALFALTGLVSAQSFTVANVHGRYVSTENAYDVSSVHPFQPPNGSLAGGPIFFATAEVMVADGAGNVCGEADGFYGGFPPPGVNLGPNLFHGTYTVTSPDGRITINTCSDTNAGGSPVFCSPSTFTCNGTEKQQVGYISDPSGKELVTVEQTGVGDPDVTGFLVHRRDWHRP